MANARKSSRHNQEKVLFILMSLIIIGLIVSGYFLFVRKILPELSGSNGQSQAEAKANVSSSSDSGKAANNANVETEAFIHPDELQILTVYFPAVGKDILLSELKRVRKRTMLIAQARQIVETILEGPAKKDLYQAVPKGTTLRGLFFEPGLFTVDLSREFIGTMSAGTVEQVLAVYSIVNSLTELDPQAKVKFLINGTEQEASNGHVDFSQPLSRFASLIGK